LDGRQVPEEGAGLTKGGAYLEVFTFPIKGKPEPRHNGLIGLLGVGGFPCLGKDGEGIYDGQDLE